MLRVTAGHNEAHDTGDQCAPVWAAKILVKYRERLWCWLEYLVRQCFTSLTSAY